jgi:hypothetical protein
MVADVRAGGMTFHCRFVGDPIGGGCVIEFYPLAPNPVRFGWAHVCNQRDETQRTRKEATALLTIHVGRCKLATS